METVTDVVCGMKIDPAKAVGTVNYKGKPHHFCSPDCFDKFVAEPEKYVKQ